MELYWKQVGTAVQEKTGITESQYSKALEEQKDTIVDLLSFCCYPESAMEAEIAEIKKEILTLYTNVIAPTISKIEVYSHDLDAGAVEAIFNLLQQITSAELTTDIADKRSFYQQTLSYCYFIKHTVQKTLAELYFERIATYKKTIRDFNHRGVFVQKEQFIKVVGNKLKTAKNQYRKSNKVYKAYVRTSEENVASLILADVQNDIGFDSIVCALEGVLDIYTERFPEIINNGYNMSFGYRLITGILEVLSGTLLVYGFLKYANLWTLVMDWFVNLFK